MHSLSLIIPAYNEAKRLPRTFELLRAAQAEGVFSGFELQEILIIDDGSRDSTSQVSEEARASLPQLRVIRVQPNQGKGNAIHEGLKQSQSDWCLVADADSATPWNQLIKLWNALQTSSPPAQIAIGSRDLPESNVVTNQSWIREHMGKTFNLIVRFITGLPFRDTQCGFKLIHRHSIEKFLPELTIKRFAWDVEFLMFSKSASLHIIEVPVTWAHQEESRVNAIKDSFEMLMRVIQLRIRLILRSWN